MKSLDALNSLIAGRFCTALDGAKSGLQVKPDVQKRDLKVWNHLKFASRGEKSSFTGYIGQNQVRPAELCRESRLGEDIIDQFHESGSKFMVSIPAWFLIEVLISAFRMII